MENIKEELLDIKKLIKEQCILQKEFLTLEETAIYLGQSKSSIYKLTSANKIPFYSPGGKKIYFKKLEIDEWILNGKVLSITELEPKIYDYLSKPLKTKV